MKPTRYLVTRSSFCSVRGGFLLALLALLASSCSSAKTSSAPSTTKSSTPTEFTGYVRSPPLDVSSVTLPTVKGTPVNMVAEPNGLLLAYFGFMSCPDICPTTLANVKKALAKQSEADRKRVQVAVITIDPSADSGESFIAYVKRFFPTGHAIRTDDPVALRSAAKVFGADYRIAINDQGRREVTHTADVYVIDDTGTVILAWPFGVSADEIGSDIARLLSGDRPVAEGT